jgi:hypothetical protein
VAVDYTPSKADRDFAEAQAEATADEEARLLAIEAAGGPKNDAYRVTKRKKAGA